MAKDSKFAEVQEDIKFWDCKNINPKKHKTIDNVDCFFFTANFHIIKLQVCVHYM